MKLNKLGISTTLSIIVSVILIILLIALPNIIEKIPSVRTQRIVLTIFSLIVIIFEIVKTYNDFIKWEYITSKFIILADLVQIIAFLSLLYMAIKPSEVTDFNTLFRSHEISIGMQLLFYGGIFLESILKKEKYKKKDLAQTQPEA